MTVPTIETERASKCETPCSGSTQSSAGFSAARPAVTNSPPPSSPWSPPAERGSNPGWKQVGRDGCFASQEGGVALPVTPPGCDAGGHLVQHGAERKQVRPRIDLAAACLLGRHHIRPSVLPGAVGLAATGALLSAWLARQLDVLEVVNREVPLNKLIGPRTSLPAGTVNVPEADASMKPHRSEGKRSGIPW